MTCTCHILALWLLKKIQQALETLQNGLCLPTLSIALTSSLQTLQDSALLSGWQMLLKWELEEAGLNELSLQFRQVPASPTTALGGSFQESREAAVRWVLQAESLPGNLVDRGVDKQVPLPGWKMEFGLRTEFGKGEHMQLSDRARHAHTAKIRAWRSRKQCHVTPSKAGMRLVGAAGAAAGQVQGNSRGENSHGLSKVGNKDTGLKPQKNYYSCYSRHRASGSNPERLGWFKVRKAELESWNWWWLFKTSQGKNEDWREERGFIYHSV